MTLKPSRTPRNPSRTGVQSAYNPHLYIEAYVHILAESIFEDRYCYFTYLRAFPVATNLRVLNFLGSVMPKQHGASHEISAEVWVVTNGQKLAFQFPGLICTELSQYHHPTGKHMPASEFSRKVPDLDWLFTDLYSAKYERIKNASVSAYPTLQALKQLTTYQPDEADGINTFK